MSHIVLRHTTTLACVFIASIAFADTWTVDDDGKADFDNIQAAIDAANNGDEIMVMPGTYTSNQGSQVVNTLGKAIWLHSEMGENVTVIDGEGIRRGVLCVNGETTTTVIEGFTIQNCNALWHDWDGDGNMDSWETAGGGMGNGLSYPTILSCVFMNNDGHRGGGGMFNYLSSPEIDFCTFTNNTIDDDASGCGMLNRKDSNPVIWNSSFTNNEAGGLGGGMYNYDSSSPTLVFCTFSENTANYYGGGMYSRFLCEPILSNCMFDSNVAVYGGGGMFNSTMSDSSLISCTFLNNTTTSPTSNAGGMGNSQSNPVLTNCTFINNTTSRAGGGLYCSFGCTSMITGCSFTGNVAGTNGGGAFFDLLSNSTMQNVSISNNSASNDGGGIYIYEYCQIALTNLTVQSNSANNTTGGVWCSSQSVLTMTGCTIDGNTAPSNSDILARKATEIQLSGTNTAGEIGLEDVGSELQFATGSTLNLNDSLNLSPQGGIRFDINNLNSPAPLTISGTLAKNGSLGVTNNSGSLANAAVGEVVPLIQAISVGQTSFSSIVLPAMPDGFGLRVTEQLLPPNQETEIAIEVIEDDGAQFENPLLAVLDSVPVDMISLDIEGDGIDEIAVLYGGTPGTIAVFAVSDDGSAPTLIPSLVANVGNTPVDCDAQDLDDDGLDDIVVANADDASITVLMTTVTRTSSHSFTSKTISLPGTDQKLSCIAAIDWNSNLNPSGDVVVGVDKINDADDDAFQVVLDVASDSSYGPLFAIPKYDYAGTEFPDTATGVDGLKLGVARLLETGFVGGTKYGILYKATVTRGDLIVLGNLDGKNISFLEVIDVDDNGGDGKLDVLIGSDAAEMVYLLPGDDKGANGFGDLIPISVAAEVKDILPTDVDGDGDVDFVVTAPDSDSYFFVLRNGGASNLRAAGMYGRAWNKQNMASGDKPGMIIGGSLDDKDEDDDYIMTGGASSGLLGDVGSMEQTNIISDSGGSSCEGDINGDGVVNVNDLITVIAAWGPCTGCDADINVDGAVNENDLLILMAAWGPCGP